MTRFKKNQLLTHEQLVNIEAAGDLSASSGIKFDALLHDKSLMDHEQIANLMSAYTGGGQEPELDISGASVAFSEFEGAVQPGSNQLLGPVGYYHEGRTYFVYQDPATGKKCMLDHSSLWGIGRPFAYLPTYPGGVQESHHRPAIFPYNDNLYIIVEKNHNVSNEAIGQARNNGDHLIWEYIGSLGSQTTYPMPDIKNGILFNSSQVSDIEAAFNKNITGDFTTGWSTNTEFSTRQADEDEQYQAFVQNSNVITDKIIRVVSGRNDDTAPATHFNRYLVKFLVQESSTTYYNWDESFSKGTKLTAQNLTDHFLYFTTGDDEVTAYGPNPAVDNAGNFYDVVHNGTNYLFIHKPAGSATTNSTVISLPGSPTLRDGASISGGNQLGACAGLMPITPNLIYGFFRITSGDFAKIFVYKTINQGQTWTEVGDLFPDVNDNIESLIIIKNYTEVPANTNFMVCATGVANPTRAKLYAKPLAFGTVDATRTDAFADVVAFTEAEINDLALRRYKVEAGKITNTGTTLNTLIDQSESGDDITAVGSPVLDNGTTPSYVTLDGTNDRLPISPTGLDDLIEGTVIIVAKGRVGVAANFLTASQNNSSVNFWGVGKSADESTRFTRAAPADLTIEGKDVVSDDWHIFAFTFQNGAGTNVIHWLDGKLQLRDIIVGTASTEEGKFFNYPATLTNISIGALIRNTSAFYNFDFKEIMISDIPFSYEQLQKEHKRLSASHNITLADHYQ